MNILKPACGLYKVLLAGCTAKAWAWKILDWVQLNINSIEFYLTVIKCTNWIAICNFNWFENFFNIWMLFSFPVYARTYFWLCIHCKYGSIMQPWAAKHDCPRFTMHWLKNYFKMIFKGFVFCDIRHSREHITIWLFDFQIWKLYHFFSFFFCSLHQKCNSFPKHPAVIYTVLLFYPHNPTTVLTAHIQSLTVFICVVFVLSGVKGYFQIWVSHLNF